MCEVYTQKLFLASYLVYVVGPTHLCVLFSNVGAVVFAYDGFI